MCHIDALYIEHTLYLYSEFVNVIHDTKLENWSAQPSQSYLSSSRNGHHQVHLES